MDAGVDPLGARDRRSQRHRLDTERALRGRRLLLIVVAARQAVITVVAPVQGGQLVFRRAGAERGVERHWLAVADHVEARALARRDVGDEKAQRVVGRYRLAVDADDHVALLEAGLGSRAVRLDARDDLALVLLQAPGAGDIVGDRLDADAEIAARHLLALHQLLDDRPRILRGDREADADIAARLRIDLRVDADHIALHVEHRAARIALVDRGIGLDEAIERAGLAGDAIERRNDAGGDGAAEPERLTDRDHPVADPGVRRIAPFHEGQVRGLDLEHR